MICQRGGHTIAPFLALLEPAMRHILLVQAERVDLGSQKTIIHRAEVPAGTSDGVSTGGTSIFSL